MRVKRELEQGWTVGGAIKVVSRGMVAVAGGLVWWAVVLAAKVALRAMGVNLQ